jgi:hypothetical protein
LAVNFAVRQGGIDLWQVVVESNLGNQHHSYHQTEAEAITEADSLNKFHSDSNWVGLK